MIVTFLFCFIQCAKPYYPTTDLGVTYNVVTVIFFLGENRVSQQTVTRTAITQRTTWGETQVPACHYICTSVFFYSFYTLPVTFLCNCTLWVICEQTETVVIQVHVCSNLSALQNLDCVYKNN